MIEARNYIKNLKNLLKQHEEEYNKNADRSMDSEDENAFMDTEFDLQEIEEKVENLKQKLDKFLLKYNIVLNEEDSVFLKMVQQKIDNRFDY